jgi:hypothetical protein
MRTRSALLLSAILLLALAPAAAAKDGAALSPALSSLQPGTPTYVTLFVSGVWRHNKEVVPAPHLGVRPVVVFRPVGGGRELRFLGTPLSRNYGSSARVTVPLPAGRRWTPFVLAGGHRYRIELQRRFTAGADYAGPPAPAPVASAPAAAHTRAVRTAAADTSSGAPAWPFVLAGALALAGLGAWRWRRGGARP